MLDPVQPLEYETGLLVFSDFNFQKCLWDNYFIAVCWISKSYLFFLNSSIHYTFSLFLRNSYNCNRWPLSCLYNRRIPKAWEPCVRVDKASRWSVYLKCWWQSLHYSWICGRSRRAERITTKHYQWGYRSQRLFTAGHCLAWLRKPCIRRCW